MATQVSINEDVLDLGGGQPRLLGGRCRDCGNHVFPMFSGCSRCAGTNMEKVPLGAEGTLWAWTVQGFPPKSPPYLGATGEDFEAYGVGYVSLPEVKVEARLTEAEPARLQSGMTMRLTTVPLYVDDDGNDVMTFAFEPA